MAVLLAVSAIFGAGCEKNQQGEGGPPDVEVVSAVQQDVPITKTWVATLDGFVNAEIRAQVTGYLIKQDYPNGAYVKKGTPLFQIDPRPFQAAFDQAAGSLAQAKADLQRAQAQLGKTEMDVARYTPLAKESAISQQELDNAVQADLAAKAQVEAAKAVIETSKAAVESARLNLEFTKIISPVNGVAGIANAQVGDFVGPQGNPLTTVSQVDPILANFTASEQDYLTVMHEVSQQGITDVQALSRLVWQLQLSDGTIFPQKGRFYALNRQVDVRTGSILVQVQFPNPGNVLRPGGFGKISAVVQMEQGALVIPQRAVSEVQGGYLVAVVGGDNKVSIQPVKVGSRFGTMCIITGGLKAGEQVVAEGIQKVRNGVVVNPKPFDPGSASPGNSTKSGGSL